MDIIRFDSRPHAQISVIVITDGLSFDDVEDPSDKLRETGIDLYAIGIKNYDLAQLQDIASIPHGEHLITVDAFEDLENIVSSERVFM